jgi:hypothetical protein
MEKKTVITVVAIVAVVVVLIAAGIGGLVWFVFKATAPPVEAVRAHLAAINQGDYAGAYSYLHTSVQQQMSLEDFQGYVESNSSVLKTTDTTFSNRSIQNNVCTLRGTHTGQDGTVTPVRWTLVHQGERWFITGFRFGDISDDNE